MTQTGMQAGFKKLLNKFGKPIVYAAATAMPGGLASRPQFVFQDYTIEKALIGKREHTNAMTAAGSQNEAELTVTFATDTLVIDGRNLADGEFVAGDRVKFLDSVCMIVTAFVLSDVGAVRLGLKKV
jgi:hypothetical protein